MEFRTPIQIPPFPFQINHSQSIYCIGSCFANHIYEGLRKRKISTHLNSHGILYHPISIIQSLNTLITLEEMSLEDLHLNNGLYHSFQHHGRFSKIDAKETLHGINQNIKDFHQYLKNADYLICTLGASFAFKRKSTEEIVANCHKFPNDHFERVFITRPTIVNAFNACIENINQFNPNLKLIFTISPVRHLRDGLIENQKSKANLILSVDEIVKQNENAFYFPSYEIMIDDLRDYRFYAKDYIHPNEQALHYIQDLFSSSFFNNKTKDLNTRILKINDALNHKPFHEKSSAHQEFITQQLNKIEQLEMEEPHLNFKEEKKYFNSILQ